MRHAAVIARWEDSKCRWKLWSRQDCTLSHDPRISHSLWHSPLRISCSESMSCESCAHRLYQDPRFLRLTRTSRSSGSLWHLVFEQTWHCGHIDFELRVSGRKWRTCRLCRLQFCSQAVVDHRLADEGERKKWAQAPAVALGMQSAFNSPTWFQFREVTYQLRFL